MFLLVALAWKIEKSIKIKGLNEMKNVIDITVVIPFYYGNDYIERLLISIKQCAELCKEKALFEIIIVNDSPNEKVCIPQEFAEMNIRIFVNEQNMGIQKTRINGLKYAQGEWILFLDQDDELVCDGFLSQIALTSNNEIVIGNGIYQLGKYNKKIFHSYEEMKYLMQLPRFIRIRNLIPSPGECLLKKESIPRQWINNPLKKNGADDWLLWILMFKSGVRVGCNPEYVYIHNDTNGNNLSSDLNKMKESAYEMYELLKNNNYLNKKEKRELENAIMFKYLQDTGKLQIKDLWKYRNSIVANICYKVHVIAYRTVKGKGLYE